MPLSNTLGAGNVPILIPLLVKIKSPFLDFLSISALILLPGLSFLNSCCCSFVKLIAGTSCILSIVDSTSLLLILSTKSLAVTSSSVVE